jgi:hypothetical protein
VTKKWHCARRKAKSRKKSPRRLEERVIQFIFKFA